MNSNSILKSFRAKRLLTQDNVAERLKISRQMYNNYENDLAHCELDLIMRILSCLNVNDNEFNEFLNALKQDYLSYKGNEIQSEKEE